MQTLVDRIQKFLQDRGWDNLKPADLAKSISIEAAELLEIFQWSHPTIEETLRNEKQMSEIRKELADVMIYCLEVAALLKIDPEEIILAKLQHNEEKYPAALMKKEKETPGVEDVYLKIKSEYRKKG